MEILKRHFLVRGTSLRAELTRHAGGTFLLKVLGLFFQLVSGVVLARILGAEGYGIYAYPMAIVGLLSIPTVMGLPNLIVRSVAQYHANGQFALMKGLLRRAHQFVFSLSLLFAALALLFFFTFDHSKLSSSGSAAFLWALLLLPITALKQVRIAALRGLRKVLLGQIPEVVVRPILFLSFLGVTFAFSKKSFSPQYVMLLQIFANLGSFGYGTWLYMHALPTEMKTCFAKNDTKTWVKEALPFMFLGLAQLINQQTDILMLGIMRPMADVGVYKAVVQGSTLVTFVLASVNMAQGPQIARLWTLGDMERLQRMITISTRIIAVATLLIASILCLWGKFFLSLLFGAEFAVGITALRILCMGQIVNGFAGSVGSILNMTGFAHKSLQAVLVSAVLNIFLNILLVPPYGIQGAAVATAVSLSAWNIFLVYWVKKYTKLHSTVFGALRFL